WLFSGISDKMSSSRLVNILRNLTFRNFSDFFVGGAERRPLIFRFIFPLARRAKARLAAWQKEVRNFCICFACKKNFWYNVNATNQIEKPF
ncbi:MAG: hypothetical protein WC919_03770, partial [Candidatus Paceibacterota bacterium]